MLKNEEVLPPDRLAIDEEVDDLFPHGDIKPVSNWSGIKYSRLAAMLRVDDPLENCVSESLAIIYGLIKHNKDGARRLARIYDRHFISWKLFNDSPLAIMESAIDRLRQIKPEEIRRLSDDEQMRVLGYAAIVEEMLGQLKRPACHSSIAHPVGG